ncbi:MAG: septum formation protein Maf [Clostridiales bacterium]|nr:septum formation protein Maf [Clostridiales bacterium]
MDIILASDSPRRKEILTNLNIDFISIPSHIDEDGFFDDDPASRVMLLALEKAKGVASIVSEPSLIIGADTLVYKDEIIGKPNDDLDAFRILKELQGGWHEVLTGLAVIDTKKRQKKVVCEKTSVHMAPMTDRQIKRYIATGEPENKAGAYAIQGRAALYIKAIKGCYYNVVGLPVHKLWEVINEFGIEI